MAGLSECSLPVAVDHDKIARILGEDGDTADTSLRAKSLERATGNTPPRTLTPFEWEQWYEEHGVPDSHRKHDTPATPYWWRRFFGRS